MFLKNKNIIFKIRRSKVTDYAALSERKETYHSIDKCYHESCTKTNLLNHTR